ncbi:MAG: GNAT family N-acetyltransferase [Lachnospiraceae bacterium]|nr:GNAT family N-acetyltransferase [Lachnospiraceae bacterium]
MRIRPYQEKDFAVISGWITDERSHALWCANLMPFPLTKKGFDDLLRDAEERFGDSPFVATEDNGKVVGFFCFSVNISTNEGMFKFVMVDNSIRNKGYGCEMIKLAVKYAFEIANADAVQLNVFPENPGAKRCYEKVGFRERMLTENAFNFKDESWGRCNMVIARNIES